MSFAPDLILAAAGIVATAMVVGTSVRAEILKCVNDAGLELEALS